ncbi:MAG: hypothetical protein KDE33_13340 [Bacteroidetes bacterium]|nr:hypothetical protein [Bacteroidota bacterium]
MIKGTEQTYRLKLGFSFLLNAFIGLGLLGFAVFFLLSFQADTTVIVITVLFAAVGLTTIFLTTNYLLRSLDSQIKIDDNIDKFEISTREKTRTYKLTDIVSIDITEQRSIGLYGFDFDFIKYTFADGKHCIVTNFMTDSYYLPAGLQPKFRRTILPIIISKTNV